MINFVLWLLFVLACGFGVLSVIAALDKRTLPQSDEMTAQFVGESTIDVVERIPLPGGVHPNSHWFTHTFLRARRKVK